MLPLIGCVITALLTASPGEFGNLYRDTLKGLDGVKVVVEEFDEATKELWLTREQIQADVELRLRMAGVPVAPSFACLYVDVSSYKLPITLTDGEHLGVGRVFEVNMSLREPGRLERRPFTSAQATSWRAPGSVGGIVGRESSIRGDVATAVRESAKRLADRFANAYLAANPKHLAGDEQKKFAACLALGMSEERIKGTIASLSLDLELRWFASGRGGKTERDARLLTSAGAMLAPVFERDRVRACVKELVGEAFQRLAEPSAEGEGGE